MAVLNSWFMSELFYFTLNKGLKVWVRGIYFISNLDNIKFNKYSNTYFSKQHFTHESVFSSSSVLWYRGLTFLMVPVFCDQVVAKLVVESDTGKRNLEISLDIVQKSVLEDWLIDWLSRQSQTGCICLTFLQGALSNESSKCPYVGLHIHTGCIG